MHSPSKLTGVDLNHYVERPDAFGPEWMVGSTVAPVMGDILAKWLK